MDGGGVQGEQGRQSTRTVRTNRHNLDRLNAINDFLKKLGGIHNVGMVMRDKRYRWVASVYGRHLPELREIAEPILQEIGDEDTEWRWMQGNPGEQVSGD